jgi:hypothetical protein
MSSIAALLRKVFVSIFDLIDAAFERKGAAMTSAPYWWGSHRHISGILQYQLHMLLRSLTKLTFSALQFPHSHLRLRKMKRPQPAFQRAWFQGTSRQRAWEGSTLRCKERIQMWPVLQLAWLWASGKGLFRCSVQRVSKKGRGWELSTSMMRVSELRTAAEAFKL